MNSGKNLSRKLSARSRLIPESDLQSPMIYNPHNGGKTEREKEVNAMVQQRPQLASLKWKIRDDYRHGYLRCARETVTQTRPDAWVACTLAARIYILYI